jgi:hypothetical protein
MSAVDTKEELSKVTVLLPEDTITKLDFMAKKALMGSRGRVIQSIVDSLWDSRFDLQQVQNVANQMQKPQTEQQATVFLLTLLFPLGNIVRRIDQYLGVTSPSPPTIATQAPAKS